MPSRANALEPVIVSSPRSIRRAVMRIRFVTITGVGCTFSASSRFWFDGDEGRLNVLWFVNGHGHQRDAKPLPHVVHQLLHARRRAQIAGRVQDADALDPRLELWSWGARR